MIITDFNEYKIDEKAIRIDYPKSFVLSKKYVLACESQENIASNSDKIFVDLDKLKLDKDWCIYKLD